MNRRELLLGSGVTVATALAGCSGSNTSSGDTEPQYHEDDHEAMLLSIDDFPDGWTRDDEVSDDFDAAFLNEDETITVLPLVEIEADETAAQDTFEDSKSSTRDYSIEDEAVCPVDYNIGDEASWDTRNDEMAITLFRHSNAVGQVAATRQYRTEVQPDQAHSQTYTTTMFEGWKNV
ncbi:hypothetical protein HYG81_22090 (plasmid) [Natrinema zhouii]|uniref:hypothetical protein n=1 Tax=Natrinema zhouii TaxID=1710539 RepID=UPI001CFF678E|nr:hypothetical protein [Natrinema zhouii]UHQ98665.1 hypothetical protein HYG81_22090 [Natrinema zhouii]